MNTNNVVAQNIAKEYVQKQDSKIIALKKLDRRAKRPAKIFAFTFGTVFCLVAGIGMCLAMQVIGEGLPFMIAGIIIGLVGFTACAVNYPIYKAILKAGKKKYAFEIIELAREICEEQN